MDAETGQRGYLLSGNEAYLEPYLAVAKDIRDHLNELHQIALISASHKHLDALAPLIDAKLKEMEQVIQLRRAHQEGQALAQFNAGAGKQLMDAIRAETEQFNRIELDALMQLEAEATSELPRAFILIVASSMFALLAAIAHMHASGPGQPHSFDCA